MSAALPDWGRPLEVAGHAGFAAEGGLAPPRILPTGLRLAEEPDGAPAFRLHLLRALPPDPGSGRLDLRLRLVAPAVEGAEVARVARGWLRLRPAAALGEVPAELLAPVPLDWNGLGLARLVLPLSATGAALVEGLVARDRGAGLSALAEIEVDGIAPRLPPGAAARLDVAMLRARLAAMAGPEGLLRRAALLEALRADPAAFGIALTGPLEEPFAGALALALADRLRARELLRPAPSLDPDGAPMLRPDGEGPDRIDWDLAEAVVAPRPLALSLDPVAAARDLAEARGGSVPLVVRGTATPLALGFHRLVLDSTLPEAPAGVLALGARLRILPRPPARPQEIRRDLELVPGSPAPPELALRLAPGEPLDWRLQAFAFIPSADGRGAERLLGEEVAGQGPRALLTPALLPLRLVELEAEPALLALGALALRLEALRPGGAHLAAEAVLDRSRPGLAFGLPRDAEGALIGAVLRGPGGETLALPAMPAEDRVFTPRDLPGFGPRAMRVEFRPPPAAGLAALELLPEDAAEGTEPVTLAFTRAEPAREFRWFCRDPFRPGLRWRHRAPGAAWSAPERGAGPLVVPPLEEARVA